MPDRFTGFLDTYDILGKAIPGVAWSFGIFLLFPTSLEIGFSANQVQFKGIAALLVAVAVVGVVFGQGIDTLARLFEEGVAWVQSRLRFLPRFLRTIFFSMMFWLSEELSHSEIVSRFSISNSPQLDGRVVTGPLCAILSIFTVSFWVNVDLLAGGLLLISPVLLALVHCRQEVVMRIYFAITDTLTEESWVEEFDQIYPTSTTKRIRSWIVARLRFINTAVTSHRSLFAAYLNDQADRYVEPTDTSISYSHFTTVVQEYFDVRSEDFHLGGEIYPFVTTHLRSNNLRRAGSFQARYSFCRSMWLTTSIFAVLFFGLYVTHFWSNKEEVPTLPSGDINVLSTLIGPLLVALLALIIALGAEIFYRIFTEDRPILIPWATGIILSLWVAQMTWWDSIVTQVSEIALGQSIVLFNLVEGFGRWLGQICGILFGYSNGKPLAVFIFGNSLLAIVVLLSISSIAFLYATGSYKTNYIEYTITETWESLNEEVVDEQDVSEGHYSEEKIDLPSDKRNQSDRT